MGIRDTIRSYLVELSPGVVLLLVLLIQAFYYQHFISVHNFEICTTDVYHQVCNIFLFNRTRDAYGVAISLPIYLTWYQFVLLFLHLLLLNVLLMVLYALIRHFLLVGPFEVIKQTNPGKFLLYLLDIELLWIFLAHPVNLGPYGPFIYIHGLFINTTTRTWIGYSWLHLMLLVLYAMERIRYTSTPPEVLNSPYKLVPLDL